MVCREEDPVERHPCTQSTLQQTSTKPTLVHYGGSCTVIHRRSSHADVTFRRSLPVFTSCSVLVGPLLPNSHTVELF
ncbi:hypothetical protein TNCV_2956311 [Trichonephila clavipes]|nr:hypothetical protein TNCV_2956311 [Trichonephila clavipes]